MPLATNLARRAGSSAYYARIAIPLDLQPHFPRTPGGTLKKELWKSLTALGRATYAANLMAAGLSAAAEAFDLTIKAGVPSSARKPASHVLGLRSGRPLRTEVFGAMPTGRQ